MTADRPQPGLRLAWGLRSYAWVVVACVLALTAAPLILTPTAPVFQADALILAQQLNVRREVLPRLGEAVFSNGAVAAAVAADPAVGGQTGELIPERLSVVAAEDSIVMAVQARDPDAATAARLANLAAAAFVDDLNRGGAGVGTFRVQAEAIVPSEPLAALPLQFRAAIGALAGLALGLGVVGLITTLRRPVVSAHDVGSVTGVPLLGTVQLPLVPRHAYPGPLGVGGIATVTRWLATVPPGRLLLISPASAAAIRQRIYVMCGVALSTLRPLRFEAPAQLIEAIRAHRARQREAGRIAPADQRRDELVIVDSGSVLDVVDPAVTNVSVVVVVPVGIAQRRLQTLAADFVGNGLVGVILVEVSTGLRRRAIRSGKPSPPRPPVPADEHRVVDVSEPGRA